MMAYKYVAGAKLRRGDDPSLNDTDIRKSRLTMKIPLLTLATAASVVHAAYPGDIVYYW